MPNPFSTNDRYAAEWTYAVEKTSITSYLFEAAVHCCYGGVV